ncbi:MAG: hypothetical protein PHD17_09590 [Methanothrix soehngenii]|nr:hypothetical protein [Methanothrix soehngenii]
MSSNLKKAGSNQRRSIVPMVVLIASGFVSWRFFVIDPVSNRINNRRAAPAGSYYPIAGVEINPVSESKKIRSVLTNCIPSESTINKEKNKPWYHFILSGGII